MICRHHGAMGVGIRPLVLVGTRLERDSERLSTWRNALPVPVVTSNTYQITTNLSCYPKNPCNRPISRLTRRHRRPPSHLRSLLVKEAVNPRTRARRKTAAAPVTLLAVELTKTME